MPESIEIYPGTNGSTHGERKEISPARNAPARETSVIGQFVPFLSILAQNKPTIGERLSVPMKR
jgi:hypothetical protein